MANTFAPFGFSQTSGTGSAPTYEQVTALIASNYSTPIFFGDPVYPLNTGYIAGSSVSPGTTQIAGVFVGCKYLSVSQKRVVWSNYWPGSDANGDVTAYIINDPNAQFLVQVGGSSSTGVTTANIYANVRRRQNFQSLINAFCWPITFRFISFVDIVRGQIFISNLVRLVSTLL